MILIYSDPARWEHPLFLHQREVLSTADREARLGAFNDLLKEIVESGELVDSAPLADPINTRTVRIRDNVLSATDGPFLEAKEHLAGYFVVDCDTIDRATEIASRIPDARQCALEVRPVMDLSGMEM